MIHGYNIIFDESTLYIDNGQSVTGKSVGELSKLFFNVGSLNVQNLGLVIIDKKVFPPVISLYFTLDYRLKSRGFKKKT